MAKVTLNFDRLRGRAPAAIARAMNRAASSAQTLMVRRVAGDLGVAQKDIRGTTTRNRRVWATTAKLGDKTVTIYASIARIPLMDFRARGPEPSRGKGRGVTARFPGGAGRYPHAFIATLPSGHRGVFERAKALTRRSKGAWSLNLPIVELKGPSVTHVFEKYRTEVAARAVAQFAKDLAHEIGRGLGGART